MNQIWTLTTTNKKLVITDQNFDLVKYLQLIVSKSYILDLSKQDELTARVSADAVELRNKLLFVKSVLDVETAEIDAIYKRRAAGEVEHSLRVTKEFYAHVSPNDEFIKQSIDSEIDTLNQYKKYCHDHKSFIVAALYDLDYTNNLIEIKQKFLDSIKHPPADENYIYEVVHKNLIKALQE